MLKTFSLVILFAALAALAGCSTGPGANADLEGERAPLGNQSSNTLNSPVAGPTSEGLPGGTGTDNPPELDSNRGTKIQ